MLVPVLFTLSGFAGLVFEVVLLRQAIGVFGSAVTATSFVLAAFLAGLGLGGAWAGPRADRTPRPLALYGRLEIGAGLAGSLAVALLGPGRELVLAPLRAVGGGAAATVVATIVGGALVLAPAALIGATLPPIARYVIGSPDGLLRGLGLLYGMNTLGGAAGVFACGFFGFELVGVSGCGFAAGAIDVGVGLTALALDRRARSAAVRPVPVEPVRPAPPLPLDADARATRVACVVAATLGGAAIVACEVAWARLLVLPLRSYAYSFSLMLALFLLGLVVGALAVATLARRLDRAVSMLALVQLGIAAWLASSTFWLDRLLAPPVEGGGGLAGFIAASVARAAPLVLPPTILSGMALPLATRGFSTSGARAGREIGTLYAWNLAGSIAGALAGGLLFLPLLGPTRLVALAGLASLAAASAALLAPGARAVRRPAALAALAVGTVTAVALVRGGESYARAFVEASRGQQRVAEVLFFHEGATDTIAVVRNAYGFHDPQAKSLLTNSIAMSATAKPVWRYMAAEGHLPVLLAPAPTRALVVCLGTGITLGAVASHTRLRSIDAVELSEGVIAALPYFAQENKRAWEDPRVRLIRADGRHHLELGSSSYDVITLEPPPPIVAGSVHLYTREFYRACRRRLVPGGVVAQWLPLHAQSLESARMTARTFLDAFPHVQLWLPSIRDAVLLGSDRPLELDPDRLTEAWSDPATAESLRRGMLETPEALLATFLLDRSGLERWVGAVPAITDDRPRMEFFRRLGRNMRDADIGTLTEASQAAREGLVAGLDAALADRVDAEREALRLYLRAEIQGDERSGVDAARRSTGTEFFRYRLGCTAEQLGAAAPAQRSRCAALGLRPFTFAL